MTTNELYEQLLEQSISESTESMEVYFLKKSIK